MNTHPLRLARLKKGLSQIDLALILKTSHTRISLVERGYIQFNDAEKKKCSEILEEPCRLLFPAGGSSK